MSRTNKLLLIIAIINLVVLAAWPQAASRNLDVKITIDSHVVTLQITKPTRLNAVLESICAAGTITCDIASNVGESETIAPVELKGNWQQIVAQLLEGSKLNYAVVPGTGTTPGKLLVAAAPSNSEVQQTNPLQPSADEVTPTGSMMIMGPATTANGAQPTHNETETSSVNDSPHVSNNQETSADSSGMMATPYAAPSGKPLMFPVSSQPLAYSPYPDANGEPMRINPGGQLTVLPYVDSQGRPLEAPAATPGQPVVPPYPLGPYHR